METIDEIANRYLKLWLEIHRLPYELPSLAVDVANAVVAAVSRIEASRSVKRTVDELSRL